MLFLHSTVKTEYQCALYCTVWFAVEIQFGNCVLQWWVTLQRPEPLPKTSLVFSYANNFAFTEQMQYQLQETRPLCRAQVSSWPVLFKSNQDAKPALAPDITKTPFVHYSLHKETDRGDSELNDADLLRRWPDKATGCKGNLKSEQHTSV